MKAWPPPNPQTIVSDFWFNELRAGRCFYGGVQDFTPVNNGFVALWNPLGSGVEVLIFAHEVQGATAGVQIESRRITAALATNRGQGSNCLFGGANSLATLYTDDLNTLPGTYISQRGVGSQSYAVTFPSMLFELAPGNGIAFRARTGATPVTGGFFWREGT